MSRIAKEPIKVPQGIEVQVSGQKVAIKSKSGQMEYNLHPLVSATYADQQIKVSVANDSKEANMQSGTARAILANMVEGLEKGFEKKLQLVGVGYRAQVKGDVLSLHVGFSHVVDHKLPKAVTCQTPTQTDIILKSYDKALLGQVAADIRAYREPEPYKGKGVRYADEQVLRKEAKKK